LLAEIESLKKKIEDKEEMEELLAQENASMEEKLQDVTLKYESCQRSLEDYERKIQFLLQEVENKGKGENQSTVSNKQLEVLKSSLVAAEGRESSLRKEHQQLVESLQKVSWLLGA